MKSEVEHRADFSHIRYAQVWEDADILLEGLQIQPDDVCVSIASAGDNALALLTQNPGKVYALDLNPVQIVCLELRVAAYRSLDHPGLLNLIGSRPATAAQRLELYSLCRPLLSSPAQSFWDSHPELIEAGIGSAGKFERYFALFRTKVLPLIHSRKTITALLQGGPPDLRRHFYRNHWNTWRWRLLFQLFFSRAVMGRMGRDPSFFRYVKGSVADRIFARAEHALLELDPAQNPYLHWILTGTHGEALPCALREENFATIRANLDRLEWRCQPLESFLAELGQSSVNAFNLSDIFEYMSEENYHALLRQIVKTGRPGARLAYWNMLAPRSRPESMAKELTSHVARGQELLSRDKAFFYSAFVLEEVS